MTTDIRTKLFAATVARPANGQWYLMNSQEKGWASSSLRFNTLLEIFQGFAAKFGKRGTDEHGAYVEVHLA